MDVSEIPEDIAATAKELVRLIKAPTVVEQLGRLLSDEERVARALLAERERAAKIADEEYQRHNTGSGFDSQSARVTAYAIREAIRS